MENRRRDMGKDEYYMSINDYCPGMRTSASHLQQVPGMLLTWPSCDCTCTGFLFSTLLTLQLQDTL
jgi:hypothetical protein